MNDLHNKIGTAKKLLLKESEINNKTHTFAFLSKDFDLSKDGLIGLFKDGLVKLNNCFLQREYINEHQKKGAELEAKLYKIRVASMTAVSSHFNAESTHNPFMDKYCGLGKGLYNKLTDKPQIELDILSFQALAKQDVSQEFISFNIDFSKKRIEEFLNVKIDSFIKNELVLAEKIVEISLNHNYFPRKTQRFLSYEKQKEDFAIAIVRETNNGYPPSNLKIDYTQIWQKNTILQTNFLETALSMEKEGLIEIRDIIEQMPKNPVVLTSDLFWQYPTIIQMKVLPNFNKYYELVYKKYNPIKEDGRVDEYLKSDNKPIKESKMDIEKVKTKYGWLSIKKNGLVKFNEIEGELNPTGEEFKVLLKIATGENYTATYDDLLGKDELDSKKRALSFVIRNIKNTLCILPAKNAKNKDCIKNIKGYGYKLIT